MKIFTILFRNTNKHADTNIFHEIAYNKYIFGKKTTKIIMKGSLNIAV